MFVDAHTHIQFPAYDEDRDAAIRRAQAAKVKMIAVGTQRASSEDAIRLAEQYPNDIWATAGFHPGHTLAAWFHDTDEQKSGVQETFDRNALKLLARHPRVTAIGECGLDYYRLGANREAHIARQKEVFLAQVAIAEELKKPLMIHCRPSRGADDAYEDLLHIANRIARIPKIVHFYVGSPAMTRRLIDAGFYFTFGGVITFARDYDEAVRMIPLDRILSETDAPYVAPAPYRGKRNEPAYVIEVIPRLAELKHRSFEETAARTSETARKLFALS